MTKTPQKPKTFETCSVEVNIQSKNVNTMLLNKITPPEFVILQNLHGPHAIKFVEKQGPAVLRRQNEHGQWMQRSLRRAELLEKLTLKYGEIRMKEVFPGENPVLPFTFDQVDTSAPGAEDDEFDDGWETIADYTDEDAALDAAVEGTEKKKVDLLTGEEVKDDQKKAGGKK